MYNASATKLHEAKLQASQYSQLLTASETFARRGMAPAGFNYPASNSFKMLTNKTALGQFDFSKLRRFSGIPKFGTTSVYLAPLGASAELTLSGAVPDQATSVWSMIEALPATIGSDISWAYHTIGGDMSAAYNYASNLPANVNNGLNSVVENMKSMVNTQLSHLSEAATTVAQTTATGISQQEEMVLLLAGVAFAGFLIFSNEAKSIL